MKNSNNRSAKPNNSRRNNNGSRKGNGSKPGRMTKEDLKQINGTADSNRSATNDPSWYNGSPQLIKDVASIPYAWATGLPVNKTHAQFGLEEEKFVPGILTAVCNPSLVTLGNDDDPINVASRQIVAFIRSFNSGAKVYDAPDYMIRIMAEASFISALNFAIRAYGTFNLYSTSNRYLPDALLEAQGINPANLRDNANRFRGQLNSLINQAQKIIVVPGNIPLFSRYAFLFSGYYCDTDNPKDQIYQLAPHGFHRFTYDPETKAGMLEYVVWYGKGLSGSGTPLLHTTDELMELLWSMLNPLIDDQDLCIMNGDMIKAYGSNLIQLGMVPDILVSVPFKDENVLWQFKNSRCMPETYDNNWCVIMQSDDKSHLVAPSKPQIATGTELVTIRNDETLEEINCHQPTSMNAIQFMTYSSDLVCITDQADPDPLLTVENTRMACMLTSKDADNYVTYTAGADVVRFYVCTTRSLAEGYYVNKHTFFANMVFAVIPPEGYSIQSIYGGLSSKALLDFHQLEDDLAAFDYCPTLYPCITQAKTDETIDIILSGGQRTRIDNYALIPYEMLERINTVCAMSLLGVSGK